MVGFSRLLELNARSLNQSTDSLAQTFERLTTGLRINGAADGAADLALSTELDSDSKVYAKAVENTNSSISLFNIASAALDEQIQVLTRIKELAAEAANGALTSTQRAALDSEAQALVTEYNRIGSSTEFNDDPLIDGSVTSLTTHVGPSGSDSIVSEVAAGYTVETATGTLAGAATSTIGLSNSESDLTGDFNGDGMIDFISVDTAGKFQVMLGVGDGTFAEGVSVSTSTTIQGFAIGDLNGDGIDDIAYTQSSAGEEVNYQFGLGDGTFGAVYTLDSTESTLDEIAIVDLDNDGDNEIVVLNNDGASSSYLNTFENLGSGNFGTAVSFEAAPNFKTGDIAFGDLDGDGDLDAIVGTTNSGTFYTLENDGSGSFGPAISTSVGGVRAEKFSVGDIDNDGDDDIIVGNTINQTVNILRSSGVGSFTNIFNEGSAGGDAQFFYDFNNDGNLDLIFNGVSGSGTRLLLGDGAGSFTPSSTGIDADQLIIGDFDNDGFLDVGQQIVSGSDISVLFGQSTSSNAFTLSGIDLTTAYDALTSYNEVSGYLTSAELNRGKLGAQLSRLEAAASDVANKRDLFADAASTIRDIDVAQEVANLVRQQVLRDSAAALQSIGSLDANLVYSLYNGLG